MWHRCYLSYPSSRSIKLADCFKNKQGQFSALQMSHFKAFFLEEYESKQYIFETYFGFCLNNFLFCFLEGASAPSSKSWHLSILICINLLQDPGNFPQNVYFQFRLSISFQTPLSQSPFFPFYPEFPQFTEEFRGSKIFKSQNEKTGNKVSPGFN